jgi:hypothetical protein
LKSWQLKRYNASCRKTVELPKLTVQFSLRKKIILLLKRNITSRLLNFITGIILLSVLTCRAQDKNNLQVFNQLVDSSIVELTSVIPDSVRNISPDIEEGTFSVFNSQIISDLTERGYKLVSNENAFRLQYVIREATTSYGDIFRDGFLGDYLVPRTISLSGSGNFTGHIVTTHNFNFTYKDTIAVDSVNSYENPAYSFTQGRLPSEPFFSSIFEPVIAVGTAALAVILFFTIRSK